MRTHLRTHPCGLLAAYLRLGTHQSIGPETPVNHGVSASIGVYRPIPTGSANIQPVCAGMRIYARICVYPPLYTLTNLDPPAFTSVHLHPPRNTRNLRFPVQETPFSHPPRANRKPRLSTPKYQPNHGVFDILRGTNGRSGRLAQLSGNPGQLNTS